MVQYQHSREIVNDENVANLIILGYRMFSKHILLYTEPGLEFIRTTPCIYKSLDKHVI